MKHLAYAVTALVAFPLGSSALAGMLDVGSSILVGGFDETLSLDVAPDGSNHSSAVAPTAMQSSEQEPPAEPGTVPIMKQPAASTSAVRPETNQKSHNSRSQRKPRLFRKLFPKESKNAWMTKTFGHR